jgi:hypothetical protein
MREHWESMSRAERDAARAQRRESAEKRRETWNAMSEEQKAAARERFREHRDTRRAAGRDRPRQRR